MKTFYFLLFTLFVSGFAHAEMLGFGCGTILGTKRINVEEVTPPVEPTNGQGVVAGLLQIAGANPMVAIAGEIATTIVADKAKGVGKYKNPVEIRLLLDDDREIYIIGDKTPYHDWSDGARISGVYDTEGNQFFFSTSKFPPKEDPDQPSRCKKKSSAAAIDAFVLKFKISIIP